MMNNRIFFLTVIILCSTSGCQTQKSAEDQVCFKKTCFNVEVVSSVEERTKGLQFRDHLPSENGMLFIFQKSWPYTFWMKDTLISLDMIWMDYSRKVVHIEENVQPCKKDPCPNYGSRKKSLYVLELNAGKVEEHKLKVGDVAAFNLLMDQ